MFIDARIPVCFLDQVPAAAIADAVLLVASQGSTPAASAGWVSVCVLPEAPGVPRHAPGCACCAPRSPQADVLTRLFQARARGEIGYFRRLAACLPPATGAALREVLARDAFLSGCFVARS